MDDFDRNYPDFDWRNTPGYKHPGGNKKCPCPKHEWMREQINIGKQTRKEERKNRVRSKEMSPLITLRFCPDHYRVYFEEVIPDLPLKYRLVSRFMIWIGGVKIVKLDHRGSDLCFFCRFGSGGYGRKTELPPL